MNCTAARRRRHVRNIALGATLLFPSPIQAQQPGAGPIVATFNGSVRGVAVGQGGIFRGIPFARSTAGALRWQPPQAVAAWAEVRDATRFGPVCPQPVSDQHANRVQSEDCLSINIASPRIDAKAKLPVLVLVHGGAYFVGSGEDGFDASAHVFNARGIVVVSMNYRLGRLGFFAHPGLRAEQPGAPVGNYWLMDQVAALKWVKRNIARFGGDPGQVTILGCSAGGSSINALMASPASRGLFARASAHSGGGLVNATRPLVQAENEGLAFAARAGITGRDARAIARLRSLSPAEVMAADPGPPNFGAIVDGRMLVEETAVAFAKGHMARVPFVAGSTSNEASIFGLMGFNAKVMKDRFDIDLVKLRPIYDPSGAMSGAELLRQVQTDFIFTAGSTGLATLAGRWQPSWVYHFAYVPPAKRGSEPGAPHCADMGYTFGAPEVLADPSNAHIAATMQDYWSNFIRNGNPNGAHLQQWPQYRSKRREVLLIDDPIHAVAGFRKPQLAYWYDRWAKRTGESIDY